jgi:mannose PTS system EIIA component
MIRHAPSAPVGIVLCCHGEMAAGLRSAAEMIVGPQRNLAVVGVRPSDGREEVERALADAAASVEGGAGVLVMTDIPGGTPCIEAARQRSGSLEIVAGVNLPALIKVLSERGQATDVRALAADAVECGRKHVASGLELFSPPAGEREGK